MRQIIYDKVRNISEKYKGYIDTEDLMKEGLTNRRRLADKQTRVLLRYKYYEMKNNAQDFSSLAPEKFKGLKETVGWCAKAVITG